MKRIRGGLTVPVVLALAWCSVAAADVFILANGGRVVGELLNPDQLPRENYTIKTPTGGQITLSRPQVKQHLRPRPVEIEYQNIRPRYPDTVEGQWALAEWCRENTLLSERKTHLERILELDPDHEKARRALGYFPLNGQWKTQRQIKEEQGYVYYRGDYLLPQEIKLLEEQESVKAAQGEWKKKLNRWRDWLGLGGSKTRLACENIQKTSDPFAVPALAAALEEDPRDQVRLLLIEALARIGTPAAMQVLAARSLGDPIPEVRLTCLDCLKQANPHDAATYFIGRLRSTDNVEINRAAVGLRRMGEPSAIGPLIEALITVHKFTIPSGGSGQMTTTFGTGGGASPGGLTVGGGPKTATYSFNNQAVLDALVSLTGGVNYGFDVLRWKAWYAAQKSQQPLDARRD